MRPYVESPTFDPVYEPDTGEQRFDPKTFLHPDLWLSQGAEQLANRTAYLRDRCFVSGARAIASVADYTALRALLVPQPGDLVCVGKRGVYRFEDDLGAGVDDEPWVIRSPSQFGTWYHTGAEAGLAGWGVRAIACLKIPGNGAIAVNFQELAWKMLHASTVVTVTDAAGANFAAGMQIAIDVVMHVRIVGGTLGGATRVTVKEGSNVTVVPGSERSVTTPSLDTPFVRHRLLATLAGGTSSVDVALEGKVYATPSAIYLYQPLTMRAVVYAP